MDKDVELLLWINPPQCYIVQSALSLDLSACVCLCVFSLLVPGFHSKSAKELRHKKWWVGRNFPLFSLPLSLTLLRHCASSRPCREFDSGSTTVCQMCYIQGREEAMSLKNFFLVLIQGLSLLCTWSTNPSLRCCYVVVVVVRLPWRWAVSRSEPRIRLRRV